MAIDQGDEPGGRGVAAQDLVVERDGQHVVGALDDGGHREQRQQAQSLLVKQNELTQLHKDNARLATELTDRQRANRALEQALQAVRTTLDEQKSTLIQRESTYAQLAAQHEALQADQTALQARVEADAQALKAEETLRIQREAQLATQADLYQDLKQQLAALRPPQAPQAHKP